MSVALTQGHKNAQSLPFLGCFPLAKEVHFWDSFTKELGLEPTGIEVAMLRIAKPALAVVSGLALVCGLVSGAVAQPKVTHHSSTKVVHSTHKSASSAAAKKAAAKKAAAKKAAAKKAAAKLAAAKKAAAKKAAAKLAAAKKASEASKQASRKSLFNAMFDAMTPNPPSALPTEMPTADPSQTDEPQGIAPGEMSSMPVRCVSVYQDGKSPCEWYGPSQGKPTAQQFAFNEALKLAYNDFYAANQAAYDAFEKATAATRDSIYTASKGESESEWMRVYLDYIVATHDAQAELNAATYASNSDFLDAKYAAIADFDAASFDKTTESGAAALAALADYRKASKSLELKQFKENMATTETLGDRMVALMKAFISALDSLTNADEITAARDAYWADLNNMYNDQAVASNDAMMPFYEAAKTAEATFLTLTGESPAHPENFPWWWYGVDEPQVIVDPPVDPLPPVPSDCAVPFDGAVSSDGSDPAVKPVPADCSVNPVDPLPVVCYTSPEKPAPSECQVVVVVDPPIDPLPPVPSDCAIPVDSAGNSDGSDPAVKPGRGDCSVNPVDPLPVVCYTSPEKPAPSECQVVIVQPIPGDKGDGVDPSNPGDTSGSGSNVDGSTPGETKPPIVVCPTCPPVPEYSLPSWNKSAF